jgi:3-deoxy-D-manno-octulosonate 8-phosphate phosphatase (KDO 8-P phosphatase)
MDNSVERRASRIKLLLMDCDGVLTDGRLMLLGNDDEQKWFSARDGFGLELWRRAGLKAGIISGRTSNAVERRGRELGIEYVRQGSGEKEKIFNQILRDADVSDDEVAFIGDDLVDIPLMRRCELAIAVADASMETQQAAHYVTVERGGYGAVREAIELMLKAQGRWSDLVEGYLKGRS